MHRRSNSTILSLVSPRSRSSPDTASLGLGPTERFMRWLLATKDLYAPLLQEGAPPDLAGSILAQRHREDVGVGLPKRGRRRSQFHPTLIRRLPLDALAHGLGRWSGSFKRGERSESHCSNGLYLPTTSGQVHASGHLARRGRRSTSAETTTATAPRVTTHRDPGRLRVLPLAGELSRADTLFPSPGGHARDAEDR